MKQILVLVFSTPKVQRAAAWHGEQTHWVF